MQPRSTPRGDAWTSRVRYLLLRKGRLLKHNVVQFHNEFETNLVFHSRNDRFVTKEIARPQLRMANHQKNTSVVEVDDRTPLIAHEEEPGKGK
jgi:hypothetical protein